MLPLVFSILRKKCEKGESRDLGFSVRCCGHAWVLHAAETCSSLRSRSVVQINASIRFEPPKINIFTKDCKRNGKDATCMTAFVCFTAIFLSAHFQTASVGKQRAEPPCAP